MKCLLFFSDFLLSNEMSGYPENKSTIIFFVSILLLSYEPDKIRQNNMDHPVKAKDLRKNVLILLKGGFTPAPLTLLAIRVILLHTLYGVFNLLIPQLYVIHFS